MIDNYKDEFGKWRKSLNGDKTKSYSVWYNMLQRCTINSIAQFKYPTYIGCTMSENFKDFQYFAEWHMSQVGFCNYDYELDKDILFEGNKLYSENTCVLVPKELNRFLNNYENGRGVYPKGVSLRDNGTFKSQISISGIIVNLGTFKTVNDALDCYNKAKEKELLNWIYKLENNKFIIDNKVIDSLKNRIVQPKRK